jgi:hypothetical protein
MSKEIYFRSYNCYFGIFFKENLIRANNNACWGGLANPHYFSHDLIIALKVGELFYPTLLAGQDLFIYHYKVTKTEKYIPLLVSILNGITPCEEVEHSGEKFLKIKLLRTYDQSLVLLSFIRNLWHSPISNYSVCFFNHLEKLTTLSDPLERLTTANKMACDDCPFVCEPGHSNVYKGLVVKTTEQLLAFEGFSTRAFLTSS